MKNFLDIGLISDDDLNELLNNLKKNVQDAFDLDPISTSEEEGLFPVALDPLDFKEVEIKCECGAEKCGFPKHSDYCPKYEK